MPIGFRNVNELWASILVETLKRLGLTSAVICPGSRSTPLTMAIALDPDIEAIPILDERSAAFFALGQAKATGRVTAVICTSGTAGANFYPAIIEAKESRVPLLILTADRPAEMRFCHSGQTIDQIKLYGNYPNWQAELAIPAPNMEMLAYLRQTIIYAWERSHFPVPGPVHLNIPFRDPLPPIPDNTENLDRVRSDFDSKDFFSNTLPPSPLSPSSLPQTQTQRGIIIAGVAQPQQPQAYCEAIAHLSKTLQFPVLAEGLSPVRNYAHLNPHIISTYDLILRNQLATQLAPEIVIQIGEMPTSKVLRSWLTTTQPQRWIIDPSDQNLDPVHGRTVHLRLSVEQIGTDDLQSRPTNPYLHMWMNAEAQARKAVDETLAATTNLFEGKAAWLLGQVLPPQTPVFIANSMPVRDVEFFWKPNNSEVKIFCNRGANGIDGTLSTALGIAHDHQSSVMLTGDLALLHDTNGFLIRNKFQGHLTIVLINNNGGGIFEMLAIAQFDPPFEDFFATPQNVDFTQLCATYGLQHELITSWQQLYTKLNPLPSNGIRILEIRTNRKQDAQWRKDNLEKFASKIERILHD